MRYSKENEYNPYIIDELFESVKRHVLAYMKKEGLSKIEMAKLLGWQPDNLYNFLDGEWKNMTFQRVVHIGIVTGVKPVIQFKPVKQ
jgi:ABC-type Zn2+ transport system substrate-binding protein/surface adhesin